MRCAHVGPGPEHLIEWGETEHAPEAGPGEIRIRVRAAGLNRADLVQRRGLYPAPSGASTILGLECSGHVDQVGEGVDRYREGDAVCALLAGGGNAEWAVCPAEHALPVPRGVGLVEAAGLPEVWATAWANLVDEGGMRAGHRVLIHAGASGVGTAAIQIACLRGARPFVTASQAKLALCAELGAQGFDRQGDWAKALWAACPEGIDLVLDPVGATHLGANQRLLNLDGRLVVIGLMGGRSAEIDLGALLSKRQRLIGSTLRNRTNAYKARLMAAIEVELWPAFEDGRIRSVLDRVFAAEDIAAAHDHLAGNGTVGKVLLDLGDPR